jgi:hypothetical protein
VFSPAGAGSTKRLQFLKDGGAEGEIDGRGQIFSKQTRYEAFESHPLLAHFYRVDLLQVRGENRLATVTVSRSRRSGVIEPSE